MDDYIYPPPPTLPAGSEVIAYMRDSGGPNQQESIGQQTRAIQDYCKKHGLVLTRVYAETASGRKTKNRDQFLEMHKTVMTCPDDLRPRGLILWAYSRFSRDIIDFNYYLFGLIKSGLVIHSMTELIPDGIAGQVMLQLKAYTSADYSIQLGKQIKRSILDKVKRGYNNGGQAPKGYLLERELIPNERRSNGQPRINIKWIPDPILAPLVRYAWELRAHGASYNEITKATEGKIYTSVNAWVTHFRNESYLGIGKAGEQRIPDHHEAIITHELWEAVREIERMNKKRYNFRRMRFPSLLAGLAFCPHCGASMVVHNSRKYKSYICGQRDRKNGFADCPNSKHINAPKAERIILETVLNRILSPDFAGDILADIQAELSDTQKIDREIGEATNALTHIEKSLVRLVQLAETTGDLSEIKTRMIELKQEQTQLTARIRELKAAQQEIQLQLTPEALAHIFNTWRDQISNATERGEIATARKLLYQFVQRIDLTYNKAVINYTYPLNTVTAEGDPSLRAHKKTTT